jgi:hypothetical protein
MKSEAELASSIVLANLEKAGIMARGFLLTDKNSIDSPIVHAVRVERVKFNHHGSPWPNRHA